MRVVHEHQDGDVVLATTVRIADTFLGRVRGLRFTRSFPDGHALVLSFSRPRRRDIDTLFVPFPTDVLWLVDGVVHRTKRLRPWLGVGIARADTVVELPAGVAVDVVPGDTIRIESGGSGADSGV